MKDFAKDWLNNGKQLFPLPKSAEIAMVCIIRSQIIVHLEPFTFVFAAQVPVPEGLPPGQRDELHRGAAVF